MYGKNKKLKFDFRGEITDVGRVILFDSFLMNRNKSVFFNE